MSTKQLTFDEQRDYAAQLALEHKGVVSNHLYQASECLTERGFAYAMGKAAASKSSDDSRFSLLGIAGAREVEDNHV